MAKYRKKPVVIDAFKWTGDQYQTEDPQWIVDAIKNKKVWFNNKGSEEVFMVINTTGGNVIADRGDYIVQGVKGEIYPIKEDLFEMTYEKAED